MRKVYAFSSVLLSLAVLAQFYLAAVGAFADPQDDRSFALHEVTGGIVVPALSIVATIAAAVARAPRRLVGLTILPLALVVVQMLIVTAGDALGDGGHTTPAALAVLGLHAVNGLAILAVAGTVSRRAVALARPPRAGVAA